jgi:hypothetical protein
MKRILPILACLLFSAVSVAQLKPRPDAFPPAPETPGAKAIVMATSIDEMASWDRYPTYGTYLDMMEHWAAEYPELCHIDTIGTSIQGRLILSLYIEPATDDDRYRPEFFYSSTIHGDELTGYVMMLRLIDTLLSSYGTSPRITQLLNSTRISINPLANPDGTYFGGDNSVQRSRRYNADGIDLNRTYPDPFVSSAKALPRENAVMIDYVSSHNFRLSANLHGGSEVMNYPWDCFTSLENPHPQSEWWKEVCKRFVDTSRVYSANHFNDVNAAGYIAGGDWYVIHGGRQDYMNYYHDCLELTMELSVQKKLSCDLLPEYWRFLAESLIGYIEEIYIFVPPVSVPEVAASAEGRLKLSPNPVSEAVTVSGLSVGTVVEIFDMSGRRVASAVSQGESQSVSVGSLPAGLYMVSAGRAAALMVKQ